MPRVLLIVLLALLAVCVNAQTTNNDDSCDISVAPAATLLLPYFEVDLSGPGRATTILTVTNISALPQFARVTIWTDLAYPVLTFPLTFTGYDVEPINLYDVLGRGALPRSSHPLCNIAALPPAVLADAQRALTTGTHSSCGTSRIGLEHTLAAGYVTIDLVANCAPTLPTELRYFTDDLLFDNVLIGDYQLLDSDPASGNFAGGGAMVHIRAVPEGGGPGEAIATNLPFTFYDRYTKGLPARTHDRRQPLPTVFAARWIQGGRTSFSTSFRIWRESVTARDATCAEYVRNGASGKEMQIADIVRFDEHENSVSFSPQLIITIPLLETFHPSRLPVASNTGTESTNVFPPAASLSGSIAGWMYLNLNNGGTSAYSVTGPRDFRTGLYAMPLSPRPPQAWVNLSLYAEGRYAAELPAAMMGNGCSAPASELTLNFGSGQVEPAPNLTP